MQYTIHYTRKNGRSGKQVVEEVKVVEANSFSEAVVPIKKIKDFEHVTSVSVV